jgi:selenide,water dikinase
LQEMLGRMTPVAFPNLIVGTETSDDAAVYRLNDTQALVATTDFFMPVVDDPYDFGRIAATNALSDVYAMGGTPILALAILGVPLGKVAIATVQKVLAGGAAVCAAAGIAVAGGHSIDNPEPVYGLVALGLVHPERVLRNSGALPGDRLLLTKGLGVGIYSAAFKKRSLEESLYAELIATTTQLNSIGAELAQFAGVHALTDVTGFGLLGHALEMCRGSQLAAVIHRARLPFLPGVQELARKGFGTGAATRNWSSYGTSVKLPEWERGLLCDPQTSGGLLIAVAPERAEALLQRLHQAGFSRAADVGEIVAGEPQIRVV